ncbi:MAG: DUF502 domain-containing protein [Candidatus Aminicenantes bacterium]|nr:DUF502 domain-containing protein [Candidatus Aminicenantes bacterium]
MFKHFKAFIFRGFLALLPLALSFFALRFLYLTVDQRVARLVEKWIGLRIPGLGLLLALVFLYLLGLAASNWLGRWLFALVEKASRHIPMIKSIYKLGMQLGRAFALPEKQGLNRVVLVEHFAPGVWSIGFVMGTVRDATAGETLLKLYIPTAPNPTAGFVTLVREAKVRDLDWTVTEAMNAVLSGGIIGPDEIR